MKKLLTIFVIASISFILIGCELSHIKSQFKKNSHWISEDSQIAFKMEGPNTLLAYGDIVSNEMINEVIFKVSKDNDKLTAYIKNDLNMDLFIDFKLDVYTDNKKFVSDKVILTVLVNNSGDLAYDTYQTVIARTDLVDINPVNYLGVNYFNDEFGIKLIYNDIHFYDDAYELFINDRPKNIKGIFKFTANDTFEMYQNDVLILTGLYQFDDKALKLLFGTNDLYQDTNSIILSFY